MPLSGAQALLLWPLLLQLGQRPGGGVGVAAQPHITDDTPRCVEIYSQQPDVQPCPTWIAGQFFLTSKAFLGKPVRHPACPRLVPDALSPTDRAGGGGGGAAMGAPHRAPPGHPLARDARLVPGAGRAHAPRVRPPCSSTPRPRSSPALPTAVFAPPPPQLCVSPRPALSRAGRREGIRCFPIQEGMGELPFSCGSFGHDNSVCGARPCNVPPPSPQPGARACTAAPPSAPRLRPPCTEESPVSNSNAFCVFQRGGELG